MNNEDLSRWKPKWRTTYAGYGVRNRDHMAGRVVVRIEGKEHTGGFYIHRTGSVKIWSADSDFPIFFVPFQQCKFTKRKEGNTYIYDVVVSAKFGGTKSDEYMIEEKSNKKGGYGLGDRGNTPEEESVIFRVPKEKVGIVGRISGRTSAIYQKKRYEDKLNEVWKEFDGTIEKINEQNTKFDGLDTTIPGLEKTLSVRAKEWGESLTSLGNILEKTKRHEWDMWKTTQKGRQLRVQKNAPRIRDADVDEMNFNSMTDFIKQYPELQSQRTIDKAMQAIDDKRKELIDSQKERDKVISERNFVVSTFEKLTQKAEDNLDTFEQLIKEAEEKVNNSPYNRSKFWKALQTDYEREATKLDLMPYRGKLEERKSVLKRVKAQHAKYQRKAFVDMEH